MDFASILINACAMQGMLTSGTRAIFDFIQVVWLDLQPSCLFFDMCAWHVYREQCVHVQYGVC